MSNLSVVVESVSIRQDAHGRYSLNDLHKAAMSAGKATENHAPAQFLRNDGVQAFIFALDAENLSDVQKCTSVHSVKGGKFQGSWAAELVAIRYAAWIDPSFEVRVYRAFRESIKDKKDWGISRHQASVTYRVMSEMLNMSRKDAGKGTAQHHYANEAKLVNWAFGGEFTKIDRESLCREDLDLLAYLEERNALLIGRGVAYDARKPMLQQYALDWRLERSLKIDQ